jgi:hypothetical protein
MSLPAFKSSFSWLFRRRYGEPLPLACGVASSIWSERAGAATGGDDCHVDGGCRDVATKISTSSGMFQEGGLLPFDASKNLDKKGCGGP